MATIVILGCLLGVIAIYPQNELPKGQVIERITVQSDSTQSYALFLPSNYSPSQKWAILYAFEPIARGKLPVTIFQEAAEKYGFIVIGSYNSQNGLDGQTLSKVLNSIWTDTHQRFSVDEKRVYATGFSGGARVATIFAAGCGCVTGVIGSGAGFSTNLQVSPKIPFIYFNAIGFDDYNFYEIRALKKQLEKAQLIHRIEKFDGAHQWLTKTVAENALAWMQLQAMKKRVLEKDETFVNEVFQKRVTMAENYLAKRQYLEAFQEFSSLANDFKGVKDVSAYEKQVVEMSKSKELNQGLREEENQIQTQEKHASFLIGKGIKLQNSEERMTDLAEIRAYIANLQKQAEKKDDSSERRIARRSLNKVYAETYETALFRYERQKQYDLALVNFEMANEIYPKSPRIAYDRARVYALNGQKKKALEYLEKAIKLGFRNFKEMENEIGFEKIRMDEKFQHLLKRAIENNS